MKSLPKNYILRLVGKPHNPEYEMQLRNFCLENGLENVEFIGQIEHDQIPKYLEEAHVLPSASKMEVQSLVVIEALASGTPVVGLSNETIDELITDDVGAWVPKDEDPAEFAKHIERICSLSREEYQDMCQAAKERVSHLDWQNVVDATADAYQEILKYKPSISDFENDMLTSLVSFVAVGEVKDFLLEVIEEARKSRVAEIGLLPKYKVPRSIQSWIRVPPSTWLISGFTVVISVIGYLLMKGRGKKN
jgi:hypothetical protein